MKRLITALISVVAVTVITSQSALAQTPDEETPANEGVCDELTTATPGLYGLCVAYCEALDCEVNGDQVQCMEPASETILEKYNQRKQSSDPEMPCIKTDCPCWDREELDPFVPVTVQHCSNNLDLDAASVTCTGINNPGISDPESECNALVCPGGALVTNHFEAGTIPFCFFVADNCNIIRVQNITRAQATACAAQIREAGLIGGWSCFP